MNSSNFIINLVLTYSKSQRIGIVIFFLIITMLHFFYFFVDYRNEEKVSKGSISWLSNQNKLDRLKLYNQNHKTTIYPFNPNFITDFKGYKLGMSVAEIDRLLAFRKLDKFVNSAEEFQAVTKVSDALLQKISPHFKFPEWVRNKKQYTSTYTKTEFPKKEKMVILDINQASKVDLMKVYGIGDIISDRILKQKEKLGAFVSMEQMQDIWGLSPEVIEKLKASFAINNSPKPKKININNATVKELSQFPFFSYSLAREIVVYRSMHGGEVKQEDLPKIKRFPVERIKIIALYLEF